MKHKGFTFLEAILVLGIAVVVIGLAVPSNVRSRQVMAEERFWHTFRQEWRQAQVRATISHQVTWIEYCRTTNEICFRWNSGKHNIMLPATLEVYRFDDIEMSSTGYVKPQTEIFESKINNHLFFMKIQLAWGGYRIEEKETTSISDDG